jgi:hypothetical protein
MIAAVIERCAGIDVGKKVLAVCIMTGAADAEPEIQQREYSTFNRELGRLRNWLIETGCTHVVMESTGSYWRPVFEILEDSVTVILANPEQVKSRRGHKTDWILSQGVARARPDVNGSPAPGGSDNEGMKTGCKRRYTFERRRQKRSALSWCKKPGRECDPGRPGRTLAQRFVTSAAR